MKIKLIRYVFVVANIAVIGLAFVLLSETVALQNSTPFVKKILFYNFSAGGLELPSTILYVFIFYFAVPLCLAGAYISIRKFHVSRAFVIFFFAVELVLALVLLSLHDQAASNKFDLETELAQSVLEYDYKTKTDVDDMWDVTHRSLMCCGFDGYRDWFTSPSGKKTDVPDSCCQIPITQCGENASLKVDFESKVYNRGCFQIIVGKLRRISMLYACTVYLLLVISSIELTQSLRSWINERRRLQD